jgi:hypothetical protein
MSLIKANRTICCSFGVPLLKQHLATAQLIGEGKGRGFNSNDGTKRKGDEGSHRGEGKDGGRRREM